MPERETTEYILWLYVDLESEFVQSGHLKEFNEFLPKILTLQISYFDPFYLIDQRIVQIIKFRHKFLNL